MRHDFPAIFEALTRRHNLTRREALAHIARLGGAAALAPVLKACGGGSGGGVLGEPVLDVADVPVDTFLYVMIENRSYDHYFGALALEEGRADVDGLSAEIENKLPDGTPVHPYRLDEFCVYDPPHSWDESHAQFNGGAMDRFVLEHYEDWRDSPYLDRIAPQVMGYHNRAQLPFYYGIADEFALGARYFCSLLGPTSPNRYYAHSASAAGMKANGDLDVILGGGVDVPTIYERLNAAGIPWKYYYYGLPFPFLYKPILSEALDVLGGMDVAKTRFIKNILPIDAYFADAAAGTLPNYCFIEPARGVADDHPPAHVQLGQAVIASLYQALAASPQWDRSLMLVTYDEHGGFFDHVAPPKTDDDYAADGFDQLGFRVPALVMGPYVKRGFASRTVYDHTSLFALMERMWGLDPLSRRDAAANPILDVFDVARSLARDPRPAPATVPDAYVDESTISLGCFFQDALVPGSLSNAAERGYFPKLWDLRAQAMPGLGRMLDELRRLGKGGLRRA